MRRSCALFSRFLTSSTLPNSSSSESSSSPSSPFGSRSPGLCVWLGSSSGLRVSGLRVSLGSPSPAGSAGGVPRRAVYSRVPRTAPSSASVWLSESAAGVSGTSDPLAPSSHPSTCARAKTFTPVSASKTCLYLSRSTSRRFFPHFFRPALLPGPNPREYQSSSLSKKHLPVEAPTPFDQEQLRRPVVPRNVVRADHATDR
eukprot:1014409-Prorocentrum_minimum.AAC.3